MSAGTDMNALPSHRAIYICQQEADVVRDLGVEVCDVYEMIRLAAANARVRVPNVETNLCTTGPRRCDTM